MLMVSEEKLRGLVHPHLVAHFGEGKLADRVMNVIIEECKKANKNEKSS